MNNNIGKKEKFIVFLNANIKWLVFVLALLVLAVGSVFVLLPKYQNINSLTEEIKSKEEERDKLDNNYKEINKLISDYQNVQNEEFVRKINNILPAEKVHEEILPQIETLVKNNGLLLNSISLTPEEKTVKNGATKSAATTDSAIGKIKISLNLVGVNYDNLKNILNIFENNLRLMDVESIKFLPDSSSASIVLSVYYSK
ncbi:MAG: hypothetical protein PHT51_05110 [Patescibacteria group bacterium]|nr:hypothetical protein [Patescibacteria group bacterium]MDD4610854.1 hypothetical protein [Patescibacteria group bacterium]